ncbi:uncharacterized protein LOC105285984 isoform X3 [Ooceraea biroi]|uniref:uncharacterized protein LOC105285984 isoform X3 n=1 Tax=Ooceraea biroi TaxID=2015173 RepID=UPI0005BE74F2|nr:uncharacterized protein LOC105285984 isoform X3 [Ooceraea biroi]
MIRVAPVEPSPMKLASLPGFNVQLPPRCNLSVKGAEAPRSPATRRRACERPRRRHRRAREEHHPRSQPRTEDQEFPEQCASRDHHRHHHHHQPPPPPLDFSGNRTDIDGEVVDEDLFRECKLETRPILVTWAWS